MSFTTKEDAYLRRHYGRHGAEWCAERLPGHSMASIYRRASTLGLTQSTPRSFWEPKEIRTLERFYPDGGAIACLGKLDRSHKAVKLKATRLGIRYAG
ncbi:MAG TPA: hypothetical protein VFL54_07750 [Gammaproteobacteria bacterium]|nr:hypothetical protein [Gammaproteobacteria bacterium]